LEQKSVSSGAGFFPSQHTYVVGSAGTTAVTEQEKKLEAKRQQKTGQVDVALKPEELENLDAATLKRKYEQQLEQEKAQAQQQKQDVSDVIEEENRKKKRKVSKEKKKSRTFQILTFIIYCYHIYELLQLVTLLVLLLYYKVALCPDCFIDKLWVYVN